MKNKQINLTDATRNNRLKIRNHYVYRCMIKAGDEEQRPSGHPLTPACGEWCLYSTPKPLYWLNPATNKHEWIQGSCSNHPEHKCGRKKTRLNENRMVIYTFSTKQDALNAIKGLKDGQEPPKDEPQGLTLPSIETPAPIGYFNSEPEPFWDDDELRHSRLI
jgi:hypothetical protein